MDEIRDLLRRKAAERGMALSDLSKAVGRNHAYLQQFLERGVPAQLPETVRPKLAEILGVSEDQLRGSTGKRLGRPPSHRGEHKTEVSLMAADGELVDPITLPDSALRESVRALMKPYKRAELWRLDQDVLPVAGYHPGDYLVVDLHGDWRRPGAIVVAEFKTDGQTIPLIRAYYPPVLFALKMNPPPPITVDNTRVIVRGVAVRKIR